MEEKAAEGKVKAVWVLQAGAGQLLDAWLQEEVRKGVPQVNRSSQNRWDSENVNLAIMQKLQSLNEYLSVKIFPSFRRIENAPVHISHWQKLTALILTWGKL